MFSVLPVLGKLIFCPREFHYLILVVGLDQKKSCLYRCYILSGVLCLERSRVQEIKSIVRINYLNFKTLSLLSIMEHLYGNFMTLNGGTF